MEHLFKLKNDEKKTVGYCKWTENWGFKYSLTVDFKEPFTHFAVAQTKSITAHPFVTEDKNGRKVFAGDRVIWQYNKDHKNLDGRIEWDERYLQWIITNTHFVNQHSVPLAHYKDIELIKES